MWDWIKINAEWVFSGVGVALVIAFIGMLKRWSLSRRQDVKAYWEHRKKLVDAALKRIQHESPNLKHIAEGKSYSSTSHQNAVEKTTFELLTKDLTPLVQFWTYKRQVKRLLDQIKKIQMVTGESIAGTRPLLARLEVRLVADCSHKRVGNIGKSLA